MGPYQSVILCEMTMMYIGFNEQCRAAESVLLTLELGLLLFYLRMIIFIEINDWGHAGNPFIIDKLIHLPE